MFAGCVPAHAAYFSIFEAMKRATAADRDGHQPLAAAACGATAALAHDICMTPFDTVKQRMQLGYYRNIMHCVKSVFVHEGIRAFYVSLPTTLAMNLPFGMIMAAVNESARKYLTGNQPGEQLTLTSSMIAGSIAGAVAAGATTPLDIIKTRLQTQNLVPCPTPAAASTSSTSGGITVTKFVQGLGSTTFNPATGAARGISSAAGGEPSYSAGFTRQGAVSIAKQILREEGPIGFMRGIVPRVLVQAPAVAISWTTYETAKRLISDVS